MARPQQISDSEILAATKKCVLERGSQVSLDYVAKKLGVTGPALLKRFQSRQELLLQALIPTVPSWFETLQSGPSLAGLEEQLTELSREIWDFFLEVMPCMMALRESDIPHHVVEKRLKTPLVARKILSQWLNRAAEAKLMQQCAHEAAAGMLLGALQHRLFIAHLAKESISKRERDQFISEVAQLFCRAVGAAKKMKRGST
jgi:AcrR family transcriptional regulator